MRHSWALQGAIAILSPPKSCSKHKITLIKVDGNEKKTSLKIISTKAETTETKLRAGSKHKITSIKVAGNEKISLEINSAKAENTEATDNKLRTGTKCKITLIKVVVHEKQV